VGSGLIYAAIIVMWALYFIPRWLRRHEELSESRSVEKFDHAMRILSRRDPTADQRYIVMPPKPEPAASSAPSAAAARSDHRSDVRSSSQPVPRRSARRKSSKTFRRRRILVALALLSLVVAAATPFTPVPWWGPLVGAFVVLVDLAHLRMQARRRRELTRTRHAVRKRLRSRLHRADSAERLAEARQLLADRRAAAEGERLAAQRAAHDSARRDAERAAGWQPTPVPLPTYVTKPVAPRVGRPIDLTKPGAWTEAQSQSASAMSSAATASGATSSEEIFDQTSDPRSGPGQQTASGRPASASGQATPSGAPSYDDYAAELDEILERRRAVND
jgi:hypothetical protein